MEVLWWHTECIVEGANCEENPVYQKFKIVKLPTLSKVANSKQDTLPLKF